MEKEHAFEDFSVRDLATTERTVTYEDEIILADNINAPLNSDEISRFILSPYPFKINFTMALFCIRGLMRIRLNLTEHEIKEGDVLAVLPGTIGECLSINDDCHVFLIAYPGSQFNNVTEATLGVMLRKHLSHTPILHLSREEMQDMQDLYRLMHRCVSHPDRKFTHEILTCYVQAMCYKGYQWFMSHDGQLPADEAPDRKHLLFNRFISLVEKHYTTERTISFYADKMCITPKYLSGVVRLASGRLAGEWIKDYVILEAKALLKTGKYTAQQVADQLNFPNASFFGKYFKAATGCTPKEYMKK